MPIKRPMPVRPPMDSIRPVRPKPIEMLERQFPKYSNDSDRFNRFPNVKARPAPIIQTQGPESMMFSRLG